MKILWLYRHLSFLFVFLACLACGREDVWYDENDIDAESAMMTSLVRNIRDRRQLTNFSQDGTTFRMRFANQTELLVHTGRIPVLSPEQGRWAVNGVVSPALVNDHAPLEAGIGQDGSLLLDGIPVDFRYMSSFLENYRSSSSEHVFAIVREGEGFRFCTSLGLSPVFHEVEDDFYVVPDYYLSHVTEKEQLAESIMSRGGEGMSAFIFFSDAHWGTNYQHSPALVRHIVDFSGIRDVFFGGDIITSRMEKKTDAIKMGKDFQSAFSPFAPSFYCVYGNHDNNSSSQLTHTERHLSDDEIFVFLQSQMTTVHLGNRFNFWFDDEKNHTRYIGLDTGRFYVEQFRPAMPATASFLAETLLSTPEDWNVVIVSHLWANAVTDQKTGVASNVVPPHMKAFLRILDAYNRREKDNFVYSGTVVPLDFTAGAARIAYCIGGHSHIDGLLHTESGIPIVTVATDGTYTDRSVIAKKGTVSEQCVPIFIQDFVHRKVDLVRVGRGEVSSFNL